MLSLDKFLLWERIQLSSAAIHTLPIFAISGLPVWARPVCMVFTDDRGSAIDLSALLEAERSSFPLYFAFSVVQKQIVWLKKKNPGSNPQVTLSCINFLPPYLNLLSVVSFQTSWRNSFLNLRPALVWTGFLLSLLWLWDLPYCQPGNSLSQILGFLEPIFSPFLTCYLGGTYSLVLSWERILGGISMYLHIWVSAIYLSSCPLDLHWVSLKHFKDNPSK